MPIAKQKAEYIAAKAALQFYADHGVDVAVNDDAIDKTQIQDLPPPSVLPSSPQVTSTINTETSIAAQAAAAPPILGKNEARIEAAKRAQESDSLDALKQAIKEFGGISLKKTATNLVFADGNPNAKIMVIGDAPATEEDRAGAPFLGDSGVLLDKILASIGLDRGSDDIKSAVYLSNVINWRPPGNRTPAPSEIEVSLPFIERHIQLVQPELLVLCGGIPAKTLLGSGDSISRLRKTWHDYTPQTPELASGAKPIPAIVTYHPEYLLKTPAQKRAVWHDMLALNAKRKELNLLP